MATPAPGSSPQQAAKYHSTEGAPSGRGFGRGRGRGRCLGRGLSSGRDLSNSHNNIRVAIPQIDSNAPPPAKALLRRAVCVKEQFADATPETVQQQAPAPQPQLHPEPASTTTSPYAAIVAGFERAVTNNQPELALKLAACLSFALPNTEQELSSTEQSTLRTRFKELELSLLPTQSQPSRPAPDHRRLLLALITRMVCAHCTSTPQIKQSKQIIAETCGTATEHNIDQLISSLETHLAKGETLLAAEQFKTIAQVFRLMINNPQLERVRSSILTLIPQLYEQAKAFPAPTEALTFLRTHLIPYIDFIYLEKPKRGSVLPPGSSQDQLHQLLSDYIDQNHDMTASNVYYLRTLVRFLGHHHHLLKRQSKALHGVLLERTPKTSETADSEGEKTVRCLRGLLLRGESQDALALCLSTQNQRPDIWNGTRAMHLNHAFKCALKAEQAGLCFEASQAQELTLQHCQRLNTLLNLLGSARYSHPDQMLWDQPWLTGSLNCSTLFTLRHLFTTRVLQPRWQAIANSTNNRNTTDQLQQMLKDYGQLLDASHAEQLQSLKAAQNKADTATATTSPTAQQTTATLPASQEVTAHTAPFPSTATATAAAVPKQPAKQKSWPHIQGVAGVKSSDLETVRGFYTNPPDKAEHPDVNEMQLNQMLSSIDNLKAYKFRITSNHLKNQELAQAWVDFLQGYYRTHPKPDTKTYERTALRYLASAAVDVLIQNAFAQIKLCDDDLDQINTVCSRIAEYMAGHVYPLNDLVYDYCANSYKKLTQIVHGSFLRPLEDAVMSTTESDSCANREAVSKACDTVYPYLMLFTREAQENLRNSYTHNIHDQLEQTIQRLSSDNDEVFTAAVNELIDIVYDKHNFFSKQETAAAYRSVQRAAELSRKGLIFRMRKKPQQWRVLNEKLKSKHRQARFLHVPPREQEYYPPVEVVPRHGWQQDQSRRKRTF